MRKKFKVAYYKLSYSLEKIESHGFTATMVVWYLYEGYITMYIFVLQLGCMQCVEGFENSEYIWMEIYMNAKCPPAFKSSNISAYMH